MRPRVQLFLFVFSLLAIQAVLRFEGGEQSSGGSEVLSAEAKLSSDELRVEVLTSLDLLIRVEKTIKLETGSYARAFGRVPDVIGPISQVYQIAVLRAGVRDFLAEATWDDHRHGAGDSYLLGGDHVSIDEEFHVRANFPIPTPSSDYLHTLARSVLRTLVAGEQANKASSTRDQLDALEGVFRGYFRYEVRDQNGVAIGIKVPVLGDVVEADGNADLFRWAEEHRRGSWMKQQAREVLERIHLAQRIYFEQNGSYTGDLEALLPIDRRLGALLRDNSPIALEEMQPDSNFGFHAEVGVRGSNGPSWSITGFGLISEIEPMDSLISQWEKTRRKVANVGESEATVKPADPVPERPAPKPPVSNQSAPLFIDFVDGEK